MPHSASPPARGVAAVELAVVLMLLSTLVFGAIEIGRALYHYDTLAKSARAAARYLAVTRPKDTGADLEAWKDAARCLAVYGRPDCASSDTPLLGGLSLAQVTVREPSTDPAMKSIRTGEGTIDIVSVSIVGYRFRSVVSFVVPDITFGGITAVMPHVYF